MKGFKYILVSVAALSMTGCYDLDQTPTDKVSVANYWQNEEDARAGIMSVYANLKKQGAFGYFMLFDTYTDVAHGPLTGTEMGIIDGTNDFLVNNWNHKWDGVWLATHAIIQVSQMGDDKINPNLRTQIAAEGYFLKALHYFYLSNLWGDLPLYDESEDLTEIFMKETKGREPRQKVLEFIVGMLDNAVADLPYEWAKSEYGRATKGAAYALRGKVKLYMEDYKGAIEDFEEIVQNKSYNYGYELYPDMMSLFLKPGPVAGDRETVFAIQNLGGTNNSLGMELTMLYGNSATHLNGRGTCMPATVFLDTYEWADGRAFNWEQLFPDFNVKVGKDYPNRAKYFACGAKDGEAINIPASVATITATYAQRDPRLSQSVIVPYATYTGGINNRAQEFKLVGNRNITLAKGYIYTNRNWLIHNYRKFVEVGLDLGATNVDRRQTPINFPLIRYADVLLMLAECYNADNQLDKAIIEFNKVRARASTNMPGLNSGAAWMQVSSREQMFDRIVRERAFELHGEGHRFWDLKRWRLGEDILDGREEYEFDGNRPQSPRTFKERHYFWPLPTEHLMNNPSIGPNNPGWS